MTDLFSIDPRDPTPIYAQLERAFRLAVATGRLKQGDQLPTVRQLAVNLRVNANTVAKVYVELERARLVETRRGVGTFVLATEENDSSRKERERQLRALEQHFLEMAAALGFTFEEIISHLRKHGPDTSA